MEKELTWEELQLQNERLVAHLEVSYLTSAYMIIGSNYYWKWYLRQWPNRPDTRIYMPFGQYHGYDGIVRCYMVDHGDCDTPDYPEWLRGMMCTQPMSSGAIMISEDGKTARTNWVKTGSETYGAIPGEYDPYGNVVGSDEASGFCGWCWGRYGIDFVKEDGKWKFFHMQLYPVTMNDVSVSWINQPRYEGLTADTTEEALDATNYYPAADTIYPVGRPYAPAPYKTFADVAPGYGDNYLPEYDRD